jgi:2-amino-4-hydroxy-6-hydroxymethyldihydropteridine diphosphokinase
MRYTAYIGLGSNLASAAGNPAETVHAAVRALATLGHVDRESSLYRTAPVGFRDQPHFINAAVRLQTDLEPENLLRQLLAIEWRFGRDRRTGVPKGPRTLDLDLLLVVWRDDRSSGEGEPVLLDSPELTLPHPQMTGRRFVLDPMAEIAPDLKHPLSQKTMGTLRNELLIQDNSEGEVTPIGR